jgi:peptide/nickel transport system permease protein
MRVLILRRLAATVPVVLGTATIAFFVMRLLPGDPVTIIVGQTREYDPAIIERLRRDYGLDQPVIVQFLIWLQHIAVLDFGRSFQSQQPVIEIIGGRVVPTAQIALMSWVVALSIGLVVGVVSATHPNSWQDWFGTLGALVGAAIPFFLTASLLTVVFALHLRWLPASGYVDVRVDPVGSLRSTLLPALTLGLGLAAVIARQTRSSLLDVLHQPYVAVARAKGLREQVVIGQHALRNALLPLVTVMGIQLSYLFGGAVITESIFAIPGMGRLLVESVTKREYAVLQAEVLLIGVTVVVANLLVDLAYGFLDPRIRLSRRLG